MKWLITPKPSRAALWLTLAVVWSLFLVQGLSMDPHHKHFSLDRRRGVGGGPGRASDAGRVDLARHEARRIA